MTSLQTGLWGIEMDTTTAEGEDQTETDGGTQRNVGFRGAAGGHRKEARVEARS